MFYVQVHILLLMLSSNAGVEDTLDVEDDVPDNLKHIKTKYVDHVLPKTKYELATILDRPDFAPAFDVDVINHTSKRFDNIKDNYEKKKKLFQSGMTPRNILRQGKGTQNTVSKANRKALERAFALMTQFVYAARYKLAYGQVLRKAYKTVIEYKIGYCFALMRDIRQQQLSLYSTMHYNLAKHRMEVYIEKRDPQTMAFADFLSFYQSYEKIVKLDVNMLDTVDKVQEYINMRKSKQPTSTTQRDSDSSDESE